MTIPTPVKPTDIYYGALAVPIAFAGTPLYIHAPDYYNSEFSLSLILIGLILAVLRFSDAIIDPLIGYYSDKYQQHRFKIFGISLAGLCISFYLFFQPLSVLPLPIWFAASLFCATFFYSACAINLLSFGGLSGNTEADKVKISTLREGFSILGLLLAVTLPTLLVQKISASESFLWLSVFLAALSIICLGFFFRWYEYFTSQTKMPEEKKSSFSPRKILTLIFAYRKFYFIYGVNALATAIPTILIIFFVRDFLKAETLTPIFLLIYFCAAIVSMKFWQSYAQKTSAWFAWKTGCIASILGFLAVYWVAHDTLWLYGAVCVVTGFAFGADLSLPPAILGQELNQTKQKNYMSSAYSGMTFMGKLALAVSGLILLPTLELVGYQAKGENSLQALNWLHLSYFTLPLGFKISAVFMMWTYKNKPYQEAI